jgi:hypothetical protein
MLFFVSEELNYNFLFIIMCIGVEVCIGEAATDVVKVCAGGKYFSNRCYSTLLFNAQSVLVDKLNFLPTRSGSETVFCLLCDLNL